jgi:hypothetical protein
MKGTIITKNLHQISIIPAIITPSITLAITIRNIIILAITIPAITTRVITSPEVIMPSINNLLEIVITTLNIIIAIITPVTIRNITIRVIITPAVIMITIRRVLLAKAMFSSKHCLWIMTQLKKNSKAMPGKKKLTSQMISSMVAASLTSPMRVELRRLQLLWGSSLWVARRVAPLQGGESASS